MCTQLFNSWKSPVLQSPNMPKATKKFVHETPHLPPEGADVPNSQEESTSSDQEPDTEVSFHPSREPPVHPVHQIIPSMYMPYIEGPKMDWTVNDGLYHHFLKWRLKCENILQYELAAFLGKQQCKKVIAWCGNFGMDQYVSWSLPKEELNLETIWNRFEEFCKPQSNEVRAHFDLLTRFCQGNRSVDEWYNAAQAQVNLATYPLRLQRSCIKTSFGFL